MSWSAVIEDQQSFGRSNPQRVIPIRNCLKLVATIVGQDDGLKLRRKCVCACVCVFLMPTPIARHLGPAIHFGGLRCRMMCNSRYEQVSTMSVCKSKCCI